MFWNREKTIINNRKSGPLVTPPLPPRKEFVLMFEILQDAERYDSKNQFDVAKILLKTLSEKIEIYSDKQI